MPPRINLDWNRPFKDKDFDQTLLYRGTITLILNLILKLNYKNIILLGIDPNKPSYFFEEMEEMREFCERSSEIYNEKGMTTHESMVSKGNLYHTIDIYLYALKEYLQRVRNVKLFVGFEDSMFYPTIPYYFNS